jgi:ribA/ribD-fused uncharacterized protein
MINEFRGKYRWLSNFHIINVVYDNEIYPSVEHAYQAAKTLNIDDRIRIKNCNTCGEAKRLGYTVKMRENWDQIKFDIMKDLVTQKFSQYPLNQWLLETGDQELVEGNTWNDIFWGVCNGFGLNNLGKILMEIRDKLKNDKINKKR